MRIVDADLSGCGTGGIARRAVPAHLDFVFRFDFSIDLAYRFW